MGELGHNRTGGVEPGPGGDAPAVRLWHCGRCGFELHEGQDFLRCETCGAVYDTEDGRARPDVETRENTPSGVRSRGRRAEAVMTARLEVVAMTVDELTLATPDLRWERFEYDAVTLTHISGREFDQARRGLPTDPGVYLWSAPSTAGGGRDTERAVIYIGLARGTRGLRGRLHNELGWIANATGRSPRWSQRWYAGHPRMMLGHDARLHYTVTTPVGDRDAAATVERNLLHVARFAAGSVPLVNGSGWWSTRPTPRRLPRLGLGCGPPLRADEPPPAQRRSRGRPPRADPRSAPPSRPGRGTAMNGTDTHTGGGTTARTTEVRDGSESVCGSR